MSENILFAADICIEHVLPTLVLYCLYAGILSMELSMFLLGMQN